MQWSSVLAVSFSPRKTIRRILGENSSPPVLLLACLTGVVASLNTGGYRWVGDRLPLWTVLVIAVLWGPISGLGLLWVWSVAVRWSGAWLGGHATRSQVRTALGLSAVPYAASLVVWIAALSMAGTDLFTSDTARLGDDSFPWTVTDLAAVLLPVLALWSAILACHAVSEVQGYHSAWRGLGSLVIAGMMIAAFPLALIAVVLWL
jgi:hypothetical protein